jgi:hypothetical protein
VDAPIAATNGTLCPGNQGAFFENGKKAIAITQEGDMLPKLGAILFYT